LRRLVLFDIDGTLLTAKGAPRRAFERAMHEVYGTAGPIATHRFDGKTDPQIARELLELDGMAPGRIDEGFARLWPRYLELLEHELALPEQMTIVLPGVRALLEALEQRSDELMLGLLTGNIDGGARLKLAAARIATPFRVGAFGSDHEQRDRLPAFAVERARALTGRSFAGDEIVVIGDTPSDVTCGRALGVRAVAVATGSYDRRALADAGAHVVLDDLGDTAAALAALAD
jgi:phosphoglycolate phosphatase